MGTELLFSLRCLRRNMQPCSGPAPDIFHRLKANTADNHERVEHKLQIFHNQFDVPAYTRFLGRFYGFWAPLERELCK